MEGYNQNVIETYYMYIHFTLTKVSILISVILNPHNAVKWNHTSLILLDNDVKTTTGKCTRILTNNTKDKKTYKNLINRTDLDEGEQLVETGTATRSNRTNSEHPNGKCINLIYFYS